MVLCRDKRELEVSPSGLPRRVFYVGTEILFEIHSAKVRIQLLIMINERKQYTLLSIKHVTSVPDMDTSHILMIYSCGEMTASRRNGHD